MTRYPALTARTSPPAKPLFRVLVHRLGIGCKGRAAPQASS
jgi:hypothetical protein